MSRPAQTAATLVSIVTPAYNAARFVGETIQSVQAQTFGGWEMLIADDGSGDNTCGVVECFIRGDPRIILIRRETRGGPAAARNTALERACGRYIAFLDSDDLWLPEKLQRQLAFMRETGAVICYTAYRRVTEDGARVGRIITVPESLTYGQLLKNTAIATLTAMVDREQAGSFCMVEDRREDYSLWLSLLRRGFVARGLNEDLARYRVVGGSDSSSRLRSAAGVWHIYRQIEKLSPPYATWCFLHYAVHACLRRRTF